MWNAPEDAIYTKPNLFLLYINDLPKALDYSIEKGNLLIIQTPNFLGIILFSFVRLQISKDHKKMYLTLLK